MICSSCGAANEAGRKFCDECGARLNANCPTCGAENRPGARFCGECGTLLAVPTGTPSSAATGLASAGVSASSSGPLGNTATGMWPGGVAGTGTLRGGSPSDAPSAPVAERRLVSILFADLVGFTTLSEGRDPEETRELLSRYFEMAREIVERYGGTIEKFIGDAVMAVWGTPTAHEDDAERAVRAGLDLVDAVRQIAAGLHARAGVLTGEAAVTLNAQGQGMVAGDLVNTASRLQSAAAPGTVLVGEATERAAAKAIAFEPAGEQVLKGKAAPVPAYRALRVVAERGGRNRADTLEAPFVGRDDELRLLRDLLHATGRDRRARLVSVVGQAGIGKTRLAWEFLKYVDGLVETIFWHSGRSPAYGEGVTFWALGEMVRSRAQLTETDDEPTTRAKIARTVAEYVPNEQDRATIEPALLALLGVEPATAGREELFAAWRMFFEGIALQGTVVLVFEDLQWADQGQLDFIDHILDWSKGLPILLVTLARPDLLERRPDWGGGRRNFVSLSLEPLPEAAMRELLAGLVPGLPPRAADAIVARADGVPLYAVETVRMLVAEGKLVQEAGAYKPLADLSSLAVPETLQALIAARLDALAPQDRALLQDAAVLGQAFTPAGLAAVSGGSVAEIEPRLRTLLRRELLALDANPRSPERGQYSFVQALIREVAYGTLARRDRKSRHLAAARFFESLGEDELAGALAAHYLAAYHLAAEGPEADALAAQARLALKAAADRAIGLGSPRQAVHFLEQALEVTSDSSEQGELLERAGQAASDAGDHERGVSLLKRAVDLRRSNGERLALAGAIATLGQVYLEAYESTAAYEVLHPAWQEFADLRSEPAVIAIGGQLSRTEFFREHHAESVAIADEVLPDAERQGLTAIVADVLVTKGSALASLGRTMEAMILVRGGTTIAEKHGHIGIGLRGRLNSSTIEMPIDPSAALATARGAIEIGSRYGFETYVLINIANAAEYAMSTGDWDWAVHTLADATGKPMDDSDVWLINVARVVYEGLRGGGSETLAELEASVAGTDEATTIAALEGAKAYVALGQSRLADARLAFRRVAESSALNSATSLPMSGRVSLWLGEADEARRDLATLESIGTRDTTVVLARQTLGAGIAALEGDRISALAAFRDALRQYRALQIPWHEALTVIDMASVLGPTEPEVRAAVPGARAILERLGARPLLERLDAALVGDSSSEPEQLAGHSSPAGQDTYRRGHVLSAETADEA